MDALDKPTALVASNAEAAIAADALLRSRYDFVPLEDAEQIVALGGDGFLLQTLHDMLSRRKVCPVFSTGLPWRLKRNMGTSSAHSM